jgi:CheY-like chemotaxis protein
VARRLLFAVPLVALLPLLASGQNDSEYYATPKTAPEFWRAAQFEIRTGSFERAAERIKGLLDLNPDDKTFFELVDRPPPGTQGGVAQFLRLRNIPRWYPADPKGGDKRNDEAKANVETLIGKITTAVEKELSNPDRIRRYANALSGGPEESTFALNELRRSGKAVPPIIAAMLTEKLPEETRSAILAAIPLLGADTVPGFLVYLPVAESTVQVELIDALRARGDYRTLTLQADTDPVPTLWYLNGKADSPELVKSRAHNGIVAALLRDPASERDPELRSAPGQLTEYARRFYDDVSNLPKLPGDAGGQADHNVWVWDGKTLKEVGMTRQQAVEHYGLRYARWALDIQPGYERAQRIFLGLAIEHVALRGGGGRSLAKVAPDLYAALATAPFAMLSDLLDESMRDKKTPVVLAVVRILGERTEGKASRPVGKPGEKAATPERDLRPGLLIKALDYPDPRVQFAAADAILKVPGTAAHGRNAQIVKILAATVAGNPDDGAKQKAIIGDPDPVRADGLAALLQRVGFDVEVVRTGRQMMRRLQDKADVDLVLIDRHIADPMLADLLPQLRADYRARTLPIMLVASSEGLTPVNLLTALARLACVVAFEDLRDNPVIEIPEDGNRPLADRVLQSPEEMRRLIYGRHQAQIKRMTETIEKAGFAINEEMTDRIEYFSLQTFAPDLLRLFAPQLLNQERIVLRRLLPPLFREELAEAPNASLKPRIRSDDLPSKEEAARIVNLMKITAGYEAVMPALRIAEFQKVWDSMWDSAAPKLPPLAPVRNPEIENRLARVSANYKNVRVVPAVFAEAGFKEQLAQATDARAPLMAPAEKKENAKAAMSWLRKMAVGEIPGYAVGPAIPAIRFALFSDELAPLAIDALVRLPSKDAQLDLANLAVAPERPIPVRTQAAQALIEHIQTFGRFVTEPQADAIVNATAATEDVELKARLLAAQGILKSSAKATGDRLKGYVPKPIEAGKDEMPPPKEKEEPKGKDEPKDKPAEKKE